jgi:hypothetical protein
VIRRTLLRPRGRTLPGNIAGRGGILVARLAATLDENGKIRGRFITG